MLGLVTLGGSGSEPAQNFPIQALFNFNISSFSTQAIKIGLINPHSAGNGFSQLTFQVIKGGNVVIVHQTFTSLAAALDYFNDRVLTVGTASSGGASLILSFSFQRNPGDSFHASMLIGTATINPLAVMSAVSRKTHGAAGTFDVNLPLTGMPGVECRSSGGNHTLVFTFNNDVVSGNAGVTTGIGSVLGSPTFAGNTMTVNLTGVANVQTLTVTVSGVTDEFGQVLADTSVQVSMLIGDTNGNGSVSASDISQTKGQTGQSTTGGNFREDLNVNGGISSSDISLVKAHSGEGVSAPSKR